MLTNRYHVLAVILTVFLAGCGGLAGIGGPSVSNAEATVVDDQPAVVFDYDVDDYATAMLEDPDGNVIHETRIEPSQNSSALLMGETQAGEYKLVIRQGSETVETETLGYEGPNLVISSVDDNWSGNALESVTMTVENTGDLPARVKDGAYEINDTQTDEHLYTVIPAEESVPVEISNEWGGTTIGEPGPIDGTVILNTTDGQLSTEFSEVLDPASLSIERVDPYWSGNAFEQVDVRVRNTGDLPTTANVTVEHQGETVATTGNGIIDPDESELFEASPAFSAYQVDSGGQAELDVYVNSASGQVSDSFEHDIAGADVSLESVDSTWQAGQLTAIRYTASNAGDVEAEHHATVEVNGETVSEGEVTIPPEGNDNEVFDEVSIYSSLGYVADSGGEHEVTMTIDTEDGPLTASQTVEFSGIESAISEIDPMFRDQIGEDGSELTSTRFSVRNDGDILMRYDTIEVEIDGFSRQDSPFSTVELEPGSSTTENVFISDNIEVESGTHELTIRLLHNGDTVASETATVSTE